MALVSLDSTKFNTSKQHCDEKKTVYNTIIYLVQQSGEDALRQLEELAKKSKNFPEINLLNTYVEWVKKTDFTHPNKASQRQEREVELLQYYAGLVLSINRGR